MVLVRMRSMKQIWQISYKRTLTRAFEVIGTTVQSTSSSYRFILHSLDQPSLPFRYRHDTSSQDRQRPPGPGCSRCLQARPSRSSGCDTHGDGQRGCSDGHRYPDQHHIRKPRRSGRPAQRLILTYKQYCNTQRTDTLNADQMQAMRYVTFSTAQCRGILLTTRVTGKMARRA